MNASNETIYLANTCCPDGNMSLLAMVSLVILNCISAVIALTGNIIVLVVISLLRSRNVSIYIIASLSVADLMVGLIMNPVLVAKLLLSVWQGDHWLSITADLMWIQMTAATSLSLCAVSYDRYIAIKSVFHYQKFLSKKRALAVIVFIWVFSITLASLRLFLKPEHLAKLWFVATLFTVFLPLVFIGFCYFHIYKAAKVQTKKIARNELSRKQTRAALRNKKAALTVAIVIGLFVLLWIPTLVASIVEVVLARTCSNRERIDFAWFWVAFLSFVSSAVNPWIYAFRIHEFRSFLKRKYGTKRNRKSKSSGSRSYRPDEENCSNKD